MNDSFSFLLFIRKSRSKVDDRATMHLRVRVNSQRKEVSLQKKVRPSDWIQQAGRVKGAGQNAYELNTYLDEIKHKLYNIHGKLVAKGKTFTAQTIVDRLFATEKNERMLIALYQEHNEGIRELVGREYSIGRYYQHNRTMKHLKNFIHKEYGEDDLPIKKVDIQFIQRFEHHLLVSKAGGRNTVSKYVTNFKKIMRIAHAYGWIKKDPFFHWKASWKPTEREVLTEHELNLLMEVKIPNTKLDRARDVFLFCCFTGLSYVDVKKLSDDDIVMDIHGQKWIKTTRTKTNTKSSVPLLPVPLHIMEKYQQFNEESKEGKILPVMSNQKLNDYLRDISELCGIKRKVTFHLSRHTFATTVTLSNGVPIESVSKMLGHSNLKTTQIYAKVIDNKLAADMHLLKNKFGTI